MTRHGSHGVQLLMSDMEASPTFTAIAQLLGFTPPGVSRGFTPIAEHDMTTAIEKLADALYDGGQVTFGIDYDPDHATHDESTGLKSVALSGAETDFRLIYPDSGASQIDFSGIVTDFSPSELSPNSGKMEATVTIEVSGAHTDS